MSTSQTSSFDVQTIRDQFPILGRTVHKKPLIYLDNAATTQRPQAVLDAIQHSYGVINSNVHRGVHKLSQEATIAFEKARETIQRFLGASFPEEVIWTRGTTEGVNLVASTYGDMVVGEGDHVLITHMEHHSNIVPWQMLCERRGAQLKVIPINDRGELVLDNLSEMLTPKVKIVALGHVSNALGTINPIEEITRAAHTVGARVLVDGAQAAPHMPIDVQKLGCDFYAISGHKMYGPTGIGALYGKRELLNAMPPYQGGGDMIATVTLEGTSYNSLPHKFEAGTPHISGAIGMAAAATWLEQIGISAIAEHEHALLAYGTEKLQELPGLKLYGTGEHKASVLSFTLDGVHPHDIGTIVDRTGVAIRAGHHCAQPLMDRYGIPATARASLAAYNTHEELDHLVVALKKVQEMFA